MTKAARIIGIDPAHDGADALVYALGGRSAFDGYRQSADWRPSVKPRGPAMLDMIRNYHENESYSHGRPTINFVDAAFEAADRWNHQIGMDLVVSNPKDHPADFINDWIWGPNGEFTGFARVNVFDELARDIAKRGGAHMEFDWRPRDRAVEHVQFVVRCLSHPGRHNTLYGYQIDSLSRMRGYADDVYCYVRFRSYEDYVSWEAAAAHDPTQRSVRSSRRGY